MANIINYNVLVCLILILLISKNVCSYSTTNSTSLELVLIVHRHGLRSPLLKYANDPYKDESKYWPMGMGQLLVQGKQQLYRLGKTFQDRYRTYITNYTTQAVKVNSSDFDRCHMSVGALLAGWFPPVGNQIWNNQLLWQPIPIRSLPMNQDKMLAQIEQCDKYTLEKNKVEAEFRANETEELKHLIKYLTDNAGEDMSDIHKIEKLHGTLLIQETLGFVLPTWTKEVYPYRLKELAEISFAIYTWNKILQRLGGGPLLNEILRQFTLKEKGENKDLKLVIYSAHDTTLTSIRRTLQFDLLWVPDFGSSFIFELHKINEQYFVKMFYLRNTIETEPEELEIPNCSKPCPLNLLYNITKDVRPEDWYTECKAN